MPANRYHYFATFVQDDWKITRKLTLNLGFRYEIYFPRNGAHDNFAAFDPGVANPGAGGRPGAVAFRAEFFNAFNRTVFGAPQGNVSAGNFGRVSSQSNSPRQGQLALRIDF